MTIVHTCHPIADKAEIRALLHMPGKELQARACALRQLNFGKNVRICAIVNIKSGSCSMDCGFCSQSRRSAAPINIYPLLENGILRDAINKLAMTPVHNMGLVASGHRLEGEEFVRLCSLLEQFPASIKKRVCVSLGRLIKSQIVELKSIGISHCHHNLESAENFYPKICGSQKWKDRYETVINMLDNGMEVCSGGIFGLGESWSQRADFAEALGKTGVRNIPLNFLDPRPGTPLEHKKIMPAEEALRVIALFRNILPDAVLRICGGRLKTLGNQQHKMFAAGANALMTGDFLTTRGVGIDNDFDMLKKLDMKY